MNAPSHIKQPILARDLGDGPHRPFGSALGNRYVGRVERPPIIGRTIKPRAAGPCKVCGERRFFCEHELSDYHNSTRGASAVQETARGYSDGK